MRDLLFIALYGHFQYAQVLAERRGLLREPGRLESGERVHFCINDDPAPEPTKPEKKRHNVRLFLPEPMMVSIEAIAEQQRGTVSLTVRKLIGQMLFGALQERSAAKEDARIAL